MELKLRFLFLLVLFSISTFGLMDLGPPWLIAVCRIQLKDGTKVEGFICIVEGGYSGFRKNGFGHRFPGDSYFGYSLFTLDEYSFYNEDPPNFRQNTTTGEKTYQQLFFLAAHEDEGTKKESLFNEKSGELTVSIARKYRYAAMKLFHIYQQLDFAIGVPSENSKSPVQRGAIAINVDEIRSFELLTEPSAKWLSMIAEARKKHASTVGDGDDYPPAWYHEIRKNQSALAPMKKLLGASHTVLVNEVD
ncbi:MAG: hypothetical protein HYR67_05675 [Bacteroidetes bacterium]|nr:hypothetical protein [Bacteroidota bacterium]